MKPKKTIRKKRNDEKKEKESRFFSHKSFKIVSQIKLLVKLHFSCLSDIKQWKSESNNFWGNLKTGIPQGMVLR